MNARRDAGSPLATIHSDPLASLPASAVAMADLAFGDSIASQTQVDAGGRHLALLSVDTLQLELADPAQRQFGDYELLEQIGEGGMGVVYRAHQRSLDRDVALKLLAAGPWASREFVERFRREAQNAARMQHPNIVAIHEVGSAEELHFFSMRLVRGGSLAALLKNAGALPPSRAAQMLRTIAEAVDYAHRLGVLHLDLKPANVLLDEDGIPHVADFGLARRLDSALASGEDEVSGTPSYMAPEQASPRTARISTATDIWGLGAILYELVTGRPPFLGDSPQDTLQMVVEGSLVGPRRIVASIPRDLEAIILKCMARATTERYPSARALADDLGRFVEGRAVRARPLSAPQRIVRWARREPRLAATAAAGAVALIVGLAATTQQWRRAEGNAHLASASAALANERLWQARIDQAAVAVTNGHGYDALPGLAANIKEREAQGLEAKEDRIRIAAVERSAPRLIDAIALGSSIYGVALSPDGKSIAVATQGEKLHLIDTATGNERWQASFHGATHFWGESQDSWILLDALRFSADGRYIVGRNHIGVLVLVTSPGFDEVLFDAATGKVMQPPASAFPNFRDATFSPDGAYAIVRSVDQHATLVRTADWQALGAAQPFDKSNPPWLVTVNARHVLTAQDTTINIHDPRTLAIRHVLKSAPEARVTTWISSPDGGSVVLGHLDGKIERVDCASGRAEAVAPSPIGRIGRIAYSPDGRWFGAVADTGEVLVWDSLTLKQAAPLMHLNATSEQHRDFIFVDAAARTVAASIDLEMGLWYLPDDASTPVRLMGESPNASAWWNRAFAYDATHGLMATDGGIGQLLLWRTQQLALRGMRGSPLPPDPLRAESGRIVAVDGAEVRLVNAADKRAISPVLELPSAASYASLSPDEGSLVAVAGHRVFVYDAATWKLRRAPFELPNDPARLYLNPDSRHALVLFADYDDGVNRQVGQVWDLVDGAPVSPTTPYAALTRFAFGADGRSMLSWTFHELRMADAMTLQPRWPTLAISALLAPPPESAAGGKPAPEPPNYIADARISVEHGSVDLVTAGDTTDQIELFRLSSRLWRFDAATGRELKRTLLSETGGASTFELMPDRRHAIVQRQDSRPLWWDEDRGVTELPPASGNEFSALALSADASMFARAAGANLVALASTRSLQWLTPPLPLPTAVPPSSQFAEHIAQLAITRDGNGIVGRAHLGELLYWDIAPDARPVERIVREAALLNPDQTVIKGSLAAPLPDADRQALRAVDPGPPLSAGGPRVDPIPARQPGLATNLFDLSASYNEPLAIVHRIMSSTYRELAPGVHRFLGVDYDVRGIVALSMKGFAPSVDAVRPPPQAVRGIRPGVARFQALDLLMAGYGGLAVEKKTAYAIVELDYRDGSRERLPLIYQQDLDATWSENDGKAGNPGPRIAWRATDAGTPLGYQKYSKIYSVHLANPHPEKEVVGLALEAVDEAWSSPLIFAISAEPRTGLPAPGAENRQTRIARLAGPH